MECKKIHCTWKNIQEDDFCQEYFTDLFNNIIEKATEYGSDFPDKKGLIESIDRFLKWLGLEKYYVIYEKEPETRTFV